MALTLSWCGPAIRAELYQGPVVAGRTALR